MSSRGEFDIIAVFARGIKVLALLGTGVAHDQAVLAKMLPLLEELLAPLRFLSDLRAIWPDLDPEEQAEIEDSWPFRERFHERLALGYLQELDDLTHRLSSAQFRGLRDELVLFIENWREQEPDRLKVFSAIIQGRLDLA